MAGKNNKVTKYSGGNQRIDKMRELGISPDVAKEIEELAARSPQRLTRRHWDDEENELIMAYSHLPSSVLAKMLRKAFPDRRKYTISLVGNRRNYLVNKHGVH